MTPEWPLFCPLTLAVLGAGLAIHFVLASRWSGRPLGTKFVVVGGIIGLLVLLLLPVGIGGQTGCYEGARWGVGPAWWVGLVVLVPGCSALFSLYRAGGASHRASLRAGAVAIGTAPVVVFGELLLLHGGLTALCETNSWTVLYLHGLAALLLGTSGLATAVAIALRTTD